MRRSKQEIRYLAPPAWWRDHAPRFDLCAANIGPYAVKRGKKPVVTWRPKGKDHGRIDLWCNLSIMS